MHISLSGKKVSQPFVLNICEMFQNGIPKNLALMNLGSSMIITTKNSPSNNSALDLYFFNSYSTYYTICTRRNRIFLLTYFIIYYNHLLYYQCFKSDNILLLRKELVYGLYFLFITISSRPKIGCPQN